MIQRHHPNDSIPGLSKELIAALEARFPARCIGILESPEQAHRYAGKVELVAYLRMLFEEYGNTTDTTLEQIIKE